MNEESEIKKALFPNLSIKRPSNGLQKADIIYGTPNMYPA